VGYLMARRPHRPADPDRVGEHLAELLLSPPDAEGFDELPDPMIDLAAALAVLRSRRI
jgi:hypothetical protein